MHWIENQLEKLKDLDQYRSLRIRQSPHVGGLLQIDGQQYIDFSSNDYLGLSSDSRLVDAVRHWAGQVGWGSGASPLISGFGVLHQALQERIASWKQTESALLFSTGFATNVSAITALSDRNSVIFSDELNHASIIDGCRLSEAKVEVYGHRDVDQLDQLLQKHRSVENKIIVTDSLFSMDGDFAPLTEITELKSIHGAMLIVDEAHATGMFGDRGSGLCEELGIEKLVDLRVGTLSKAVGSIGGYVAASRSICQWLVNCARPYIFSTAQPEAVCAAALASIDVIETLTNSRQQLQERARQLRESCEHIGLNTGGSTSHIIPIIVGSAGQTLEISKQLMQQGLFVPAIRPPAVADNQSRLRISLTAAHSEAQIKQLENALSILSVKA